MCIENACMVRGSKQGSNGVLHLIRTIIRTSHKTTYDILKADGRFKSGQVLLLAGIFFGGGRGGTCVEHAKKTHFRSQKIWNEFDSICVQSKTFWGL